MNYYDREPELLNKKPSRLKQHIRKGMSAFLVIAAGVVFSFAVFRISEIASAIGKLISVLSPVICGLVIAFLANPLVKQLEKWLRPLFSKVILKFFAKIISKISRKKEITFKEEIAFKLSRGISIVLTLLIYLAAVAALFNMIIPELYKNISDLVTALPGELKSLVGKINRMLSGNTTLDNIVKKTILNGTASFQKWAETDLLSFIQTDLLKQTNSLITSVTMGVINVVSAVMNILIGIIISVYLLFSKERFISQSKKAVYALASPRHANIILHIARKANEIFGGFIIGKVIDSLIIGVLCFIGLSILKMPYTLLVSVIVGITNMIPFFGPYLGAIPSTALILLVNPIKGVYFLIFIILLQQLDGNIIGPKILGDSTGLSSFWIIFSILIGGGLFGVFGMIIGVPSFALIYYVVKMYIRQKLKQKNLPVDTASYTEMSFIDENGEFNGTAKTGIKNTADLKEDKTAGLRTKKDKPEDAETNEDNADEAGIKEDKSAAAGINKAGKAGMGKDRAADWEDDKDAD